MFLFLHAPPAQFLDSPPSPEFLPHQPAVSYWGSWAPCHHWAGGYAVVRV